MTNIVLIGGIVVTCTIVILLAMLSLRTQRREVVRLQALQQAWAKAQEVQRHHWEEQQHKEFIRLENNLVDTIEETARLERQRITAEQTYVIDKLASLPYIEDTPLPLPNSQDHAASERSGYQPHSFQGAYLANADLSYRYLRNADLRDTNLAQANLFMADLTGACLRGANLSEADLSAANLSFADLTGAILTNANMLVTDLNNTILIRANLLQAHQLTTEQIHCAVIDGSTQLDDHIDITRPRHPRIPLF